MFSPFCLGFDFGYVIAFAHKKIRWKGKDGETKNQNASRAREEKIYFRGMYLKYCSHNKVFFCKTKQKCEFTKKLQPLLITSDGNIF